MNCVYCGASTETVASHEIVELGVVDPAQPTGVAVSYPACESHMERLKGQCIREAKEQWGRDIPKARRRFANQKKRDSLQKQIHDLEKQWSACSEHDIPEFRTVVQDGRTMLVKQWSEKTCDLHKHLETTYATLCQQWNDLDKDDRENT